MATRSVRITVSLPANLVEAVDRAVRRNKLRGRSEFVAIAVRRELAAQERACIDAAFARMADDDESQAEALSIAEEFAHSDREALRESEALLPGQ